MVKVVLKNAMITYVRICRYTSGVLTSIQSALYIDRVKGQSPLEYWQSIPFLLIRFLINCKISNFPCTCAKDPMSCSLISTSFKDALIVLLLSIFTVFAYLS